MNTPKTLISNFGGSAYPAYPDELVASFEKVLKAAPEPQKVPAHQPPVFIVPHIDFRVNLEIYGMVYRRMAQLERFPEKVIILGVGHRCPAEFSCCPFDYETVLGRMETDAELWDRFQKACEEPLANFPSSYEGEHSIEFVVIWLQALQRILGLAAPPKILPVLQNGLHEPMATGAPPNGDGKSGVAAFFGGFQRLVGEIDLSNTAIIASIDGCHVGPRFDHPFAADEKVQDGVREWEDELWNLCRSDRFKDFFNHLSSIQNAFFFDGVGVLTLLLQTFRVRALLEAGALWYEDRDRSFVTFSGGVLAPL